MKTLYYSLVYPHLLYAIEVWGSTDDIYLNKLFVLQKKIVRLMTFSDNRQIDFSFPPSDPLFLKMEIIKIHDVFKLMICKFIFKCLNKTTPVNFHNWYILTSQLHRHNTRSSFLILQTVFQLELYLSL